MFDNLVSIYIIVNLCRVVVGKGENLILERNKSLTDGRQRGGKLNLQYQFTDVHELYSAYGRGVRT